MAKFLNTKQLSEWIPRIIDEAERELIILAPYIQTSERLEIALKNADKRSVETLIIYREEKLKEIEREKFFSISNLNLMHHPNLHAKLYLNESHLLITSMNMYEYSEKNNREMGILIDNNDLDSGFFDKDEDSGFMVHWDNRFKREDNGLDKVKREIWDIIRGAEMEKESADTIENGFEFEMLLTEEDLCKIACNELNEIFSHKRFEPNPDASYTHPICRNFYDRIDVGFDNKGIFFQLKFLGNRNKQLIEYFKEKDLEDTIPDFKVFAGKDSDLIFLYRLYNSPFWNSEETSLPDRIKKYKVGIEKIIDEVKFILSK